MILAAKAQIHREDIPYTVVEEIPFTPESKVMFTKVELHGKMYLYAKFFNPLTHNLMKIKIKRLGKGYYDSFQKEIKSKPGDNAAISAKEAK